MPRTPSPRRLAQWCVLAVPPVVLGIVGWTHRWITDDGFIYLRIVRQVQAGNGPVFNAGERVEVYTSPLWLALLWLGDLITPLRLEWLAVWLGLLLSMAGLAFAIAGASRLARREAPSAFLVPVGALVLLPILGIWFFVTSGLETGLVFAWLGGCCWILAAWAETHDRRINLLAAAVLGLGWLVRPELLVYSVVFCGLVLWMQWHASAWRERTSLVAAMVALPLVYQLLRMGYFATFTANTALAKEGTRARWDAGWDYLNDFVRPYGLWLVALILIAGAYVPLLGTLRRGGSSRSLWVVIAFVAAATLNALYVVRVGGDYLHARLLVPALFAACAPVAVVPAVRRHAIAVLVAPWALVCAVWLRPVQVDEAIHETAAGNFIALPVNEVGRVTLEDAGWQPGGAARAWYTGPAIYYNQDPFSGDFVRLEVPGPPQVPVPAAAMWAIGVPGYAMGTDFYVLDLLGLADPVTARFELEHRGITGHEKPAPAPWTAARITAPGRQLDASDVPTSHVPLIPPTDGDAFLEQVAWARAALRCPDLRDLVRTTTEPLTVGGFFSNMVDSVAQHRLRIPADPRRAYRELCGAGTPPEVRAARAAAADA